jgi:hypothetical protein
MIDESTNEQTNFPTIKEIYSENFNGIDIFNKVFYSMRFPHRHFKYTSQIIDDAISIVLSNSFAIYCESHPKFKKKHWPEKVANSLMKKAINSN